MAKTKMSFEFEGTAAELIKFLSAANATFPNQNVTVTGSFCSDGSTVPADPLFQAFIEFCDNHGVRISEPGWSMTGARQSLYQAKNVAGARPIEAIKQIRALTGLGLKESKDFVERYLVPGPGF